MIVAGIGCRTACGADEIIAIVRRAIGLTGGTVALLAAPAFKRDRAGTTTWQSHLARCPLIPHVMAGLDPAIHAAEQPPEVDRGAWMAGSSPAMTMGERIAPDAIALGMVEAARELGAVLIWIDDTQLAAVQMFCPTRSLSAARATGFASVAEACALAGAGPDGRLVLPRIAHARVTCALAECGPA